MITKKIRVEGMTCSGCQRKLEKNLAKIPKVLGVRADFATSKIEIDWEEEPSKGPSGEPSPMDHAIQLIEKLGYEYKGEWVKDKASANYLKVLGTGAVLTEVFVLARQMGWLEL